MQGVLLESVKKMHTICQGVEPRNCLLDPLLFNL
jgi:hypothetical protein